MKFKIISPLDIRTEPSFVSGASMGLLQPGFILEAVDEVIGEMWLNSKLWYRDTNGYYYWSGAMEAHASEIIPEGQTVFPDTSFPEWMRDLRVPEIWKSYTGKSVGVAVVDTGIDLDNKDMSFSPDIFMYKNCRSLQDEDGHGTHCAGLIGARNRNGFPIGVAPDCQLFICKISEGKILTEDAYERYLEAMEWCVRNNDIRIISISWASFIDDEGLIERMQQVVNAANEKGKVVVCAIGQVGRFPDRSKRYPVSLENTIGVGMMPRKDKDQYPYITPHLKVVTHGFDIPSYFKDGTTERQSGTSQACAIVSGILALFAEKENGGFSYERAVEFIKNASSVRRFNSSESAFSYPFSILDGKKLFENLKSQLIV